MSETTTTGANSYFTHMGVASAAEAAVLSNEYIWTIIEVLRNAGGEGLTPMKVLEKVREKKGESVSRSKVYALLRRLSEMEWVIKGEYIDEINDRGRKHILNSLAGDILVDEKFEEVVRERMQKYVEKELFPAFLEFSKEVLIKFNDEPKTRKWIPDRRKASYCTDCHGNHEAVEFFDCLISIASTLFQESDAFETMMKKERFASEKYTVKTI